MSEGHPVTIITVDEDEKLTLDVAALESVLNQAELRDRPVCLLPIAGAFWLFHDLSFDILLPRCFSQGQVILAQCFAPPSSSRGERGGVLCRFNVDNYRNYFK